VEGRVTVQGYKFSDIGLVSARLIHGLSMQVPCAFFRTSSLHFYLNTLRYACSYMPIESLSAMVVLHAASLPGILAGTKRTDPVSSLWHFFLCFAAFLGHFCPHQAARPDRPFSGVYCAVLSFFRLSIQGSRSLPSTPQPPQCKGGFGWSLKLTPSDSMVPQK